MQDCLMVGFEVSATICIRGLGEADRDIKSSASQHSFIVPFLIATESFDVLFNRTMQFISNFIFCSFRSLEKSQIKSCSEDNCVTEIIDCNDYLIWELFK